MTAHVVAAPELTLAGLQAREDITAATNPKFVLCAEPFSTAVMRTLWSVAKMPAAAMKVAELAPACTVTLAGTVSRALVSDSVTLVPADAIWSKVTVQEAETLGATTRGLQNSDVKLGVTVAVIVPPAPVVWMALPVGEVLSALVTFMVVEDVAADSVTVRTTTTPFLMMFAFNPPEPSPVRKQA